MNEEQKQINEFDELFKENQIKDKPEIPKSNSPYFLSILYYLLVMFVLSTVVGLIFLSSNSMTVTLDQNEQVLQMIATESSVITLLPEATYDQYAEDHALYVDSLGVYEGNDVLVSLMNTYAYDYLLDSNDTLIVANLEAILTGTRETWDDDMRYDIMVYESSLNPLPAVTTVDTQVITAPVSNLTSIGSSLWNFITYIMLTPVLALVLLRRDITADILVFKKRWHEFISPVLIGYALVLVGNFVANFISTQMGALLGVMPSTAANQLSIEQSLSSNGAILILVSAVILGPIAEELIFRRSIFALFKNDTVGLVVSALAFGAVHLLSETSLTGVLVNGLVYIILGFVFGYIYLRSKKNLAVIITVHMLSNLISVLAVLLLL